MAGCPRITDCPLFQQLSTKGALKLWMDRYCRSDFGKCERLRLAEVGRPVPVTLLPNGRTLKVSAAQAEMNDVV